MVEAAGLVPCSRYRRSAQTVRAHSRHWKRMLGDRQQQVGPFKHRPPPQSAFVVQLGISEQVQRQ
jgi:hypothetical protein